MLRGLGELEERIDRLVEPRLERGVGEAVAQLDQVSALPVDQAVALLRNTLVELDQTKFTPPAHP